MSRPHPASLNGQEWIDVAFAGGRPTERVETTNPAGSPSREELRVLDRTAVQQ